MAQHNNANSRSMISESVVYVNDGDHITFPRQDMTFCAKSGATGTHVTCPAWSDLPAGLRFTIDNSYGNWTFTITPASGDALVVDLNKVAYLMVSAEGYLHQTVLAVVTP